jgi:hypothetical protein
MNTHMSIGSQCISMYKIITDICYLIKTFMTNQFASTELLSTHLVSSNRSSTIPHSHHRRHNLGKFRPENFSLASVLSILCIHNCPLAGIVQFQSATLYQTSFTAPAPESCPLHRGPSTRIYAPKSICINILYHL